MPQTTIPTPAEVLGSDRREQLVADIVAAIPRARKVEAGENVLAGILVNAHVPEDDRDYVAQRFASAGWAVEWRGRGAVVLREA